MQVREPDVGPTHFSSSMFSKSKCKVSRPTDVQQLPEEMPYNLNNIGPSMSLFSASSNSLTVEQQIDKKSPVFEGSNFSQLSENIGTFPLSTSHVLRGANDQADRLSQNQNSVHENSSTLVLRSEDSDSMRGDPLHSCQTSIVPEAYNNNFLGVRSQDMVNENQRQNSSFP